MRRSPRAGRWASSDERQPLPAALTLAAMSRARKYADAPLQRGLAGVRDDEAPLPSEQALSGEVLGERRREALTGLRKALGERPDEFTPEEWRVVIASLSPDDAAGATGGRPGATRSEAAILRARQCFPGLSPAAAVRAYREASQRPHVRDIVADVRALEGVDVLAQRDWVRRKLMQVASLADVIDTRDTESLVFIDPSGAAKCASAAAAALKSLMDLDGLKVALGGEEAGVVGDPDAESKAALQAMVSRVATDLGARKQQAQQALPVVDTSAC